LCTSKWLPKDFFSEILDDCEDLVVIEHNLDVIRCSRWAIDLGSEGGDKGGEIVVTGTPEEVSSIPPDTRGVISSRYWRSMRSLEQSAGSRHFGRETKSSIFR
jgi:hypothetical protein